MAVATPRPTATPAPYTPAPTSTPTLTPTPIIYVIKKGDTPLGIANMFGVSLRELQDTNGITDPRALRVGQELIIPDKDQPEDQGPTAVPTPLPFVIENVTLLSTTQGGLWGLGEIRNTNGLDLEQAAVSAALLDGDGNTLTQEEALVQLDLIAPGERAPFAVRFREPPSLGLNATGIRTQFQLTSAAKPETIDMGVDEESVPTDPVNCWTYDEATWYLVFHGDAIPSRGSEITAKYTVQPGAPDPTAGSI